MGLFSPKTPTKISSVPGYGLLPAEKKGGIGGFLGKVAPFLAVASAGFNPDSPMNPFILQSLLQKREDKKELKAKAQLDAIAQQVITDPTEWAAYQIDPKGWAAKHMDDLYSFHEVSEGNDAFWGKPGSPNAVSYHRPKKREIANVVYNDDTGEKVYAGPPPIIPGTEGSFFMRSDPIYGNGGASGGDLDSTPTIEDGHQYTPGPGGRANQANWKEAGGATGQPSRTFPRPY